MCSAEAATASVPLLSGVALKKAQNPSKKPTHLYYRNPSRLIEPEVFHRSSIVPRALRPILSPSAESSGFAESPRQLCCTLPHVYIRSQQVLRALERVCLPHLYRHLLQ
ncbi:hypothetical protein QR680_011629 [Steinernema hermaphroditum]|uniref:Uncharacterized protein n=1 Tax=Steinernema hermaphroditum TaxID=289476 RepID=A0AA39HZ83_9BILA|nr:hypothetical protein QR680_011629 [Steinernema hermaphroditum]